MKKLFLLLALVGTIFFSACEGGGDVEEENGGGTPSIPKIELAKQSIEVEFEPAEYSVDVTSPYSWEATTKNSWIKIKTATGIAGTKTLKFSVTRNEEEEIREGTITLKNTDYNLIAEFYVTQKAFFPEITLDKKELNFAVEGGTQEFAITANFGYEVKYDADWLTIEKNENGISVTVPNYVEVDERTAEITISNEKYGVSKVVKVLQGAFVPELTISPEALNFTVEGGTQEVAITANFGYEVKSDADWLTIDKNENGISVTVPNYVEVDERTAEITILNEKYSISKTVKVAQCAFEPKLDVTPTDINFTAKGGEQSVEITANFEYEVSTIADWVTYTKTENGITVSVPKHEEVKERTAEITISNKKYGVSKNVTVAQCASEPKLDVTPTDINFTTAGGSQDIYITANVEYEVSTTADWVIYTKTENGITVSAPKHEEVKERTAEITISNEKYGVSNNVKVSQAGMSEEEYAKRVIFYTTSDNKVITPSKTDAFGANIVSNTYENGKGIIKFDAPVTLIGKNAFNGCSSLTSVTIPDSVTSIEVAAFYWCSSLTSVTIGNSVTSIGERAFQSCSILARVDISDLSAWYKIAFGYCGNPLCNGANLYLNGKLVTELAIPSDITEIKNYAFYGCRSLTSVTIPDSVTSIGEQAFYDCCCLTAFYGKYASADKRCLIIDGVLNSFAPALLTSDTYTIPDSVTSIGEYVFSWSSLTSVTIPDSVTSIGNYAFYRCSSLTSITIPDSVTSIGDGAFSDCFSLTNVTIGNSVTSIGWDAFKYCNRLTSVTIPDSVTSIGNYAFEYCRSLKNVYCKPTTPPQGAYQVFDSNASGRKIYVPTASVNAYKSAQYWSDYASDIVGYDF